MTLRFWLAGILFALISLGAPLGTMTYESGLTTVAEAPAFTLTSTGYENGTLGDPVTFSLSDYEGRTVLIDFMAIACTSCRLVEREVLEPIWDERRHDDAFALVSIDTWADPESGAASFGGETDARLVAFQQEHDHDWRHALDTDKVYRKYDAIALPKIAVIGPEGQLVEEWTGQPRLSEVEAAIERSLAGDASAATVFRYEQILSGPLLFAALGLVVGIASFFAPCSVGLIPAYMGFLLQGSGAAKSSNILRAGLVTGVGIVSIYAVIAVILAGLAAAGFGDVLGANLERIRPIMAVLLIVFGGLMLFKISWDWLASRLGMGQVDGRRGFFAFGVGYGLAAFGCTGPLFLPILVAAFSASIVSGIAAFITYSVAIAGFVFIAAALIAGGNQTGLRRMLAKTEIITRVSAVLLMVAGVWLIWIDWRAGVLF